MLLLLLPLSLACPPEPHLRDPDDRLVVLAQNLQFILTGRQKNSRAELLAQHLENEPEVDLLLLSEARSVKPLAALKDWCFYGQGGESSEYHWEIAGNRPSPGGLVLGVRQRDEGRERRLEGSAGRAYLSRPVTFAEGFLGRIGGFVKGWASLAVDGLQLVWTHTQASYLRHPERGAGRAGEGRQGQFAELAEALAQEQRPVLLTGDLNLQDGLTSSSPEMEAAAATDRQTVSRFEARSGVVLQPATCGTWMGSIRVDHTPVTNAFFGAFFDRVGLNQRARSQKVEVECQEIKAGNLRVSDHRGLLIRVSLPGEPPKGSPFPLVDCPGDGLP